MAAGQYRRILTPPKGSFFLYGVRSVGKSTWARETFPGAHIVDLLDESRYQALLANPALLGLELRTLPAARVVVLDEVQRVPALLNEVHRAIARRSSPQNRRRDRRLAARSIHSVRGGPFTPAWPRRACLLRGRADLTPVYALISAD